MLPSRRRRLEDTAAREAEGESLWTTEFDRPVRVRLAALWKFASDNADTSYSRLTDNAALILRQEGGWQVSSFGVEQITNMGLSTDLLVDGLAAGAEALRVMDSYDFTTQQFQREVNAVLNEHRVAHKFVDGELVPFESDELMREVVEPTIRLLVGVEFKAAHDSYLKALHEISSNDPGDAITDAAAALQQVLEVRGAKGNALGSLMKDAKAKGLLGPQDQALIDGIGKFIDWVNADRTASGDAHKQSDAVLADAWLVVHVVGALIVRLADPTPRGSSA